jgi:hypothetical protein
MIRENGADMLASHGKPLVGVLAFVFVFGIVRVFFSTLL